MISNKNALYDVEIGRKVEKTNQLKKPFGLTAKSLTPRAASTASHTLGTSSIDVDPSLPKVKTLTVREYGGRKKKPFSQDLRFMKHNKNDNNYTDFDGRNEESENSYLINNGFNENSDSVRSLKDQIDDIADVNKLEKWLDVLRYKKRIP